MEGDKENDKKITPFLHIIIISISTMFHILTFGVKLFTFIQIKIIFLH